MKSRIVTAAVAIATAAPSALTQSINVAEMDARLADLAVETAGRGPVIPIPLRSPDGRVMGAVYDRFLIGVVFAKSALDSGRTPRSEDVTAQPAWQSRATTVVAFPVTCDGKPNPVLDIRWKIGSAAPAAPRLLEPPSRGARLESLPGVVLPDDTLAARFVNALTINASVEVDYRDPWCQGAAKTASFPVQVVPSRSAGLGINGVKLPAGQEERSPTTVRVRAELDPKGRPRFLSPVDGPPDLTTAAIALLRDRTFDPASINGTPMPLTMTIPVVFTADGAPGVMSRPGLPASATPGQTTSSTVVAVPMPAGTPVDLVLARAAAARAKQGEITPIPIDAANPRRGYLVDGYLIGALRARAAANAGTPLDDAAVTAGLVRESPIVIALPLECGNRRIAATDISLSAPPGVNGTAPAVVMSGPPLTEGALTSRVPGLNLPADAMGRAWRAQTNPFPDLNVTITYAESCNGEPSSAPFPVRWTRAQPGRNVAVFKFPDGSTLTSPITVPVRGVVDEAGVFHPYLMTSGPAELQAAAFAHAAGWVWQPARVNTTVVPGPATAAISFNATGPTSANAVTTIGPPPAGITSSDGMMMSSTIGGRSTEDFRTADAAGLTVAASKCAIADDPAFGVTKEHAIKVGGNAMGGPARERAYLAALRGPNGEGLRVVRLGSVRGPDGTILDLYEAGYPGQTPVRLYLDEYHEETLKAPQGLVCAAPLAK